MDKIDSFLNEDFSLYNEDLDKYFHMFYPYIMTDAVYPHLMF